MNSLGLKFQAMEASHVQKHTKKQTTNTINYKKHLRQAKCSSTILNSPSNLPILQRKSINASFTSIWGKKKKDLVVQVVNLPFLES